MDLKECYGTAGGNADLVLQRFRTEERIIKYLSRFLEDQSFQWLEVHLRSENYEEAFRMAHSLKGICMNLGLLSLQEAAGRLTENLRGRQADENTPALFEQVKEAYQKTASAIRRYVE